VIFESLLGPNVADPDLIRRCDIIFPVGDTTTLAFEVIGSEVPRSRVVANRGELGSVGVGGVLTIIGAMFSPGGGVLGGAFVSMVLIFAVRGRSGELVEDGTCDAACLSGNIDPILDATLPRLLSPADFSFNVPTPPPPPGFLSGLVFGLEPRFGVKACFNLPTGEGDRLSDPFAGARSVLSRFGVDAEAARISTLGKVAARGVGPSS